MELSKEVDAAVQLQVQILEDDLPGLGDELLDSTVTVFIVRGTKSGTGTFTLKCVNEPSSIFPDDDTLQGEDGKDDDETGTNFRDLWRCLAERKHLGRHRYG